MSRAQPQQKKGQRGKAISTLLLAASVLALLRPTLLCAQETELRGEVSESAILADQQRKVRQLSMAGSQDQKAPADAAAQDIAPTTTYLPASAGAVPDDMDAAQGAGSIFDQPAAIDDTFDDNPAPAQPRRPSTARQRAADEDKAKDKAADKKKAKKTTTATTATDDTGTIDADEDTTNRRAVTVDSVDFEPQGVEIGSIHEVSGDTR